MKSGNINTIISEEGCHISHFKGRTSGMKHFHCHDFLEILFARSSNLKCLIGDNVYTIEKNSLVFFHCNALHRTIVTDDNPYERYVIAIQPQFIRSFSGEFAELLDCIYQNNSINTIHLDDADTKTFLRLCKEIYQLFNTRTQRSRLYLLLWVTKILLFINERFAKNNKFDEMQSTSYSLIKPVLEYISTNYMHKITIDLISKQFFLSKTRLTTLFKRVTGLTINDYIIGVRIVKSKELLARRYLVIDVAEKCGFVNQSHFIRTFHKHVGCSPKQYLKNITAK